MNSDKFRRYKQLVLRRLDEAARAADRAQEAREEEAGGGLGRTKPLAGGGTGIPDVRRDRGDGGDDGDDVDRGGDGGGGGGEHHEGPGPGSGPRPETRRTDIIVDGARSATATATATATAHMTPGDGDFGGGLTTTTTTPRGMAQQDVQNWFATYLVERGLVTTKDALVEELVHLRAVIKHLVHRTGEVLVVEEVERREGEDDRTYRLRAVAERVLELGPNATAD